MFFTLVARGNGMVFIAIMPGLYKFPKVLLTNKDSV